MTKAYVVSIVQQKLKETVSNKKFVRRISQYFTIQNQLNH